MTTRKRGQAVFITGEHGVNRVWLWKRSGSDSLYLGWYDTPISGPRRRRALSLGQVSIAEGKRRAEALASELRQEGQARAPAEITLRTLVRLYYEQQTPTKSRSAQSHDRRALPLFLRCWGEHRAVSSLRPLDWDLYVRQRRAGTLAPEGREGRPVRDRVLEQDLSLIRAVLHWGVRNELLDREPMAGCKIPREKNVRRPLLFEEEFEAMLRVADDVHPMCGLALLLAHETGHRSQSVRMLRWDDVDLAAGRIRWRAEHEKSGKEHVVPVSPRLLDALRQLGEGRTGWIFASDRVEDRPVGRELFESWWHRLEELAGLPRIAGRGWHSLRRKFATERKQGSLTDLAFAGGWTGTQTLTRVYIQPDEASVREVVASRQPVRLNGNGESPTVIR